MEVRLTGDWSRLRQITNNLVNHLEDRTLEGIYETAYNIRDMWQSYSEAEGLGEEYEQSIEVIERKTGAYVGPTAIMIVEVGVTPEGGVIVYTAKCPVHHYYREVKRVKEPEKEIRRFTMPEYIKQQIPEFKYLLRKTIREKLIELIK